MNKINLKTESGRAQFWTGRLIDAHDRLKFAKMLKDREEALGLLNADYKAVFNHNDYLDINDALPAFEDIVHASLPDIPDPDVELRFPQSVPCSNCSGQGTLGELPCPFCNGEGVSEHRLSERLESFLGIFFNESMQPTLRNVLWDDFTYGIGFGKVVWHEYKKDRGRPGTFGVEQQAVDALNEVGGGQLSVTDQDDVHYQQHMSDIEALRQINPDDPRIAELEEHAQDHLDHYNSTTRGRPLLRRVPAGRILYDPFAQNWEEVRWFAELSIEPIADIREIEGVKNVNPVNLPPVQEVQESDLDYAMQRAAIWRIHDIQNDQYIILPADCAIDEDGNILSVSSGNAKPILETDWPFPYVPGLASIYVPLVTRHTGSENLRGISSLALCLPPLRLLAMTNRLIVRHAKKHSQYKKIFPRGTADQKFKADLKNEVADTLEMPQAMVGRLADMQPPPIPDNLIKMRALALNSVYKILGSSSVSQGGDIGLDNGTGVISATEASLRGSYHDARIIRRKRAMGQFLEQVALMFLLQYREFGLEAYPVIVEDATGRFIGQITPGDIPQELSIQFDLVAATQEERAAAMTAKQNFFAMAMNAGYGAFKMMREWGHMVGIKDPGRFMEFIQQPQSVGEVPAINQGSTNELPKSAGMETNHVRTPVS